MSGIIIGTAGHVDHGKTTLIKLLTGQDTDVLPEEKKRGISIDLGFAWMAMPEGEKAGIIDVPGHERFIGNMLAGSARIDIALLVIAADEGIMPQTKEHAAILDLLGVKQGIIVISKADLVDDEWLGMLSLELSDFLKDTVFSRAPIVAVSSIDMRGIDELKHQIFQFAGQLMKEPEHSPKDGNTLNLYFPVDRVFSVAGFGTVATGTIHSGSIGIGDQLRILPQDILVRVRGLHIHGSAAEFAQSGQRVAVNVSGAAVADFKRGSVVVVPSQVEAAGSFVGRMRMLAEEGNSLATSNKIRVHIGTDEITGKIRLLEQDSLMAGESSLVQVMLDRPSVIIKGLRYIIRSWDAQKTIGGGEIIAAAAGRMKRQNREIIAKYRLLESGDSMGQLRKEISDAWVWQASEASAHDKRELLKELVESGWAVVLTTDAVAAMHRIEEFTTQLEKLLGAYHIENPIKDGMERELARKQMEYVLDKKAFGLLLTQAEQANRIKITGNMLSLKAFEPEFSGVWAQVRERILFEILKSPYSPPSIGELRSCLGNQGRLVADAVAAMRRSKELVEIGGDMLFLSKTVEEFEKWLAEYFAQHEILELGALRDAFGTSRKYAMALLEYFDGRGITHRQEEGRVAGDNIKLIK